MRDDVAVAPARRFPLYIWDALATLPKRRSLVKRLLDQAAMSIIFGASNSGKTFIAVDLAASVARGIDWRDRKVEQGAVVYIAAEGGLGIEERFAAYAKHHNIEPGETPLYVVPAAVDMCSSSADTDALVADIITTLDGQRVVLVIIDTLSRVMAGGNENGPDDMGAFVANCDRLRQALKAHVTVIHHTGKDEGRGARGHSLLRAAADTEIEIARDEATSIVTETVTKQRDHKGGEAFAWRLVPVEIGQDDDGAPVTSCALVAIDETPTPARRKAPITGAAKVALDLLRRAIDEAGEVPPASNHIPEGKRAAREEMWRRYAYEGGIAAGDSQDAKQKAFRRSANALQAAGFVSVWSGWVWIV